MVRARLGPRVMVNGFPDSPTSPMHRAIKGAAHRRVGKAEEKQTNFGEVGRDILKIYFIKPRAGLQGEDISPGSSATRGDLFS